MRHARRYRSRHGSHCLTANSKEISMFDLTGKKALVTGATGGIGEEIAKALHACGATLAIHGTREEKLNELAAELGERVSIFPANLSDREAVKALGEKAEAEMGGIDILVNNAGITRDGLFVRMSDKDWDDVIEVNLTSVFRLTREIAYPMMRRRGGRIINITSIVGVTGNPGQANYCASKAGMIGFTKSLAQEIASRNVTVNCVAPGFIASAMTHKLNDKQKDAIMGAIPMKRMGSAAEIAAAVVFLASAEAAYVTGQTIHVNGGMAMI
jgi:3-oxoacyl-[acyl-carrier protein] reductase